MTNKIRVLQIISGFAIEGPLGGIERFGIELANAFADTEIEPIVCGMWAYDTPHEKHWVDFLQSKGIGAFFAADWDEHAPYKSFYRMYQGVLKANILDVDIIHSHCQFGDVLALLLKRKLSAKALVRTVHNEREWGKRPLRKLLLTNLIYPLTFQMELGVSQKVVDNLDQRFIATKRSIQAIKSYNALNFSRFENSHINTIKKRQEMGFTIDDIIIGTVGRLSEQKGYSILIQAAAAVVKNNPNSFFLIIGTGPLEQELKNLAIQMGIMEQIIFLGSRHDIEYLYPIMDVFVNSSLWEGLPTVIMESMAARTPVIATDVGGNKELVKHNDTGWLVPPADFEQLANAIDLVLQTDSEQIKSVCEKAYTHVRDNFSIIAIARQYEQIYKQLL